MEYALELKCRNSWILGICLFGSGKLSKGILFAQLYLSLFLNWVSLHFQKIKNITICIFICEVTFSWKKMLLPDPIQSRIRMQIRIRIRSSITNPDQDPYMQIHIVDIVSSLTGYGSGPGSITRPLILQESGILVCWETLFVDTKRYKYIDFIQKCTLILCEANSNCSFPTAKLTTSPSISCSLCLCTVCTGVHFFCLFR